MKILFLSSEVAPFSKTGGLADVAEGLPQALASLGQQVTVITPLYSAIGDPRIRGLGKEIRLRFPFGEESGTLHGLRLARNHQVVFIEHAKFFNRSGLYNEEGKDYPDNHRRFAFFAIGALAAARALKLSPDIVHLNDWQTGLAALALAGAYQPISLGPAQCVFTIHNLAYQGLFPPTAVDELGLARELFAFDRLEFYGRLSFIKAGLVYANALTTVSKTYAEEIQTPVAGCGLDGLLRQRRDDLHGILNAVNYAEWTPSTDRLIPHRFSARDLSGKERCKIELCRAFGLPAPKGRVPLFGMVSRLTAQKGIDILIEALSQLLREQVLVVLLGSGDRGYEQSLVLLAQRSGGKMSVRIGYDQKLAHGVEAGSDFFLMPSRYEPCGLSQMYSMRYGTVPIVRATGGLDDTVADISERNGTGLKFQEYSGQGLAAAMMRAVDLYRNPRRLRLIQARGMKKDFSWRGSARQYQSLYRSLASRDPKLSRGLA